MQKASVSFPYSLPQAFSNTHTHTFIFLYLWGPPLTSCICQHRTLNETRGQVQVKSTLKSYEKNLSQLSSHSRQAFTQVSSLVRSEVILNNFTCSYSRQLEVSSHSWWVPSSTSWLSSHSRHIKFKFQTIWHVASHLRQIEIRSQVIWVQSEVIWDKSKSHVIQVSNRLPRGKSKSSHKSS